MKKLFIPLSFVLILILAACKENTTSQTLDTSVIKPLEIGNYWVFNRIEYISESDSLIDEPFKEVVLGDTSIDGKKLYYSRYFEVNDTMYNDTIYYPVPGIVKYYYNNSKGLNIVLMHIDMMEIWFEESLFLKYPASSNDTYKSELWGDFKVVSTNEKVTVPAGTFTCYKFVMEAGTTDYMERYYYYYSPGIGCIKFETSIEMYPDKEMFRDKEELVSYKLY